MGASLRGGASQALGRSELAESVHISRFWRSAHLRRAAEVFGGRNRGTNAAGDPNSPCRIHGRAFDKDVNGKGDMNMRVIVLVKASKESETGQMPSEEILRAMGKYNEQLVNAGVMQAGEGLHPTSKGKRVRFSGSQRTVIDGPFAETKELVAGFWIWKVKSIEDAVEWLKKAPFDGGTEVEIRPIFEAEDFGKELTPELRTQEERLRTRMEEQKK
jgi:hypothetical protein